MLAFLLFAVAFAGKVYHKDLGLGMYIKIIPGDCNYAHKMGSFIMAEGDKVQYYKSKDCSGDPISGETTETTLMNNFILTIKGDWKDEIGHAGFINFDDDENCPNEKYSLRTYIDDACLVVGDKSFEYFEEDGKMNMQAYKDGKCSTKEGNKEELFKCDTCEKGIKYQCGAFSTMILAIFLVLAFLF